MLNIGHVWVLGTSSLIAFIAYSPQLSGLIIGAPFWQLLLFNGLVGLIWFNYFLAVRTDPGGIPDSWQPPGDLNEIRYCKKCEVAKPPRAHHCRYCKRCILRYDHHCPWINNCVGNNNYPHFLRFLFYVDLSCAMHLYLLTKQSLDETQLQSNPSGIQVMLIVVNYVTCIPVLVCVGLFSLYHFWNMSSNTTTVEGSEIDKVKKMIRRGKIKDIVFPFDVGLVNNVTSVLGYSLGDWLLSGKMSGDGLSYPSVTGSDPYHWPPRDPYESLRQTWELEAEIQKSKYPPYHPMYSALDAESDDDVPLAEVRSRSVRLRRGSEGFEVRPRGLADFSYDDESEQAEDVMEQTESDWEELYRKRLALYDSDTE